MYTRRSAIGLALTFPFWRSVSFAQEGSENPDLDIPPQLSGRADFAQAWSLEPGSEVVPLAAAPDLEPGYSERFSRLQFTSAKDIDAYFKSTGADDFTRWFNAKLADKGDWHGSHVPQHKAAMEHFQAFWNASLALQPRTLLEFLSYMSVFINECGGLLVSQSERFGSPSHPGISYLYDRFKIVTPNRTFWKASYNTGKDNIAAGLLFNNHIFNDEHGLLPPANALMHTADPVWVHDAYPRDEFPTKALMPKIGYILQADFFKFRGRGLIQTTWRTNYRALVPFVTLYSGTDAVLSSYAKKWNGMSYDEVCTRSTSAEWDTLFEAPELLCTATADHARRGRYLPLSSATDVVNGEGAHSLIYMGNSIGGTGYGELLKRRVRGMCHALGL